MSTGAARPDLVALVPRDPLFAVRAVAISAYVAGYLWWSWRQGLILDRISASTALGLFLLCAFVGLPWRRWAVLVGDALLYAAMWFAYEMTRGAADRLGAPYQLEIPRDLDRALFFGADPSVTLQRRLYVPGDVRWYDAVASVLYFTHFIVPVVAVAVLWVLSRHQWVRFMRRFATLLVVACAMFVLVPTVPPWMAADRRYGYGAIAPVARHTGRGITDLGLHRFAHDWRHALDWGNAVAAMPSLHAGFAMFVVAFFLPWVRPRWARVALFAYPLGMLVALVYFAEHWVVDGLVGWLVVGGSFLAWNRLERRTRERRAGRARDALDALDGRSPAASAVEMTAVGG